MALMVKLILASNSPRRKKIFTDMGLKFEVIPSNYDEKTDSDEFSYEKIEDIATQKCLDVYRRVDNESLVFAADTVVVHRGKILGKPHTKEVAFEMLKELSGETHSVVTAICAINKKINKAVSISTTSYVKFTPWTDEMIHYYIDNFNPLDKAGSYGIQELPEGYIDKYEGSFENIVGLCPEAVKTVLAKLEYNI
jgi:septum formation protein